MTSPATPEGTDALVVVRPAGLAPRVVARAIDALTIGILQAVLILPWTLPRIVDELGGLAAITDDMAALDAAREQLSGLLLVAGIVGTLVTIGYFVLLESRLGTTLGKRLLGLRVLGPDDGHPGVEASVRRNAWTVLDVVPVVGSLLRAAAAVWIMVSINADPDDRGVHDRFAGGVRVVRG